MTRLAGVCLDPAVVGFDAELEEYVTVAGLAGFQLVEVPINWVAECVEASSVEHARALFADARVRPAQFTCAMGVPANLSIPAGLFADRLAELTTWARVAHNIGCGRASFYFDSRHGGGQLALDTVIERATAVAGVLMGEGIVSSFGLVEPSLLAEAPAVWEGIARTGAGLLVDTFSLVRAGLGPSWVSSLPAQSIAWVRVADAPAGRVASELRHEDRLLPGDGVAPVREYVAACRRRGYEGPVSIEAGGQLRSLTRLERTRRALAAVVGVE